MVEHVDFQQLAGANDVARKPDVGLGRGRIATWVVVSKEHCRGIGADRGAKHIARVGDQRVERAARKGLDADQPPLGIHQHHVKVFHLQQSIVFAQQRGQFFWRVEYRRFVAQLVGHALGQAERRLERDRLVAADALDAQLIDRRLRKRFE